MTVFDLHSEPLKQEWLDAYGHLNEAYYLVPFSNATWALQDALDIGVSYFDETGGALYTVETHLRYLKEVCFPAQFEIKSMIFAHDAKKLHFGHIMLVDGIERATFECLGLHFDSRQSRVAPFPKAALEKIKQVQMPEMPDWACRSISIAKK